jgi:hypothetical protein
MKTDKTKAMETAQAELDRRREEHRRDVPPGIEQEIAERNAAKCGKIPLLRAIAAVQAEMPILRKTEKIKAGQREYSYVPLGDIWAVLQPLVHKHGLLVTNMMNGGVLKTHVWHVETGESIWSDHPVNPQQPPQALGSTLTYARRYNLNELFQIVADKDDDATAAMQGGGTGRARLDF